MTKLALTLALATSALVAPASAATFDAFTSFNGTQGAGNFFYLRAPISGGPASLLNATINGCGALPGASSCLDTSGGPNGGLPGVYKSTTAFTYSTVNVPNDRLLFHPGPSDNVLSAWVAPTTSKYKITGLFNALDVSPTGVFIYRFTNAPGSLVVTGIGPLAAGNPNASLSFTQTLVLDAGEFYGFGVNPAGNYFNDSTGVNFTVTAVPEPAAWAMMIAGFGLTGAMLRRRRPVARHRLNGVSA